MQVEISQGSNQLADYPVFVKSLEDSNEIYDATRLQITEQFIIMSSSNVKQVTLNELPKQHNIK